MLIVMHSDATTEQVEDVLKLIRDLGFKPHAMPGATRTAIGVTGNPGPIDPGNFEFMPGVAEAIRVSKPYKLVSRDLKHEDSVIKVGEFNIGGSQPAIIAGPCAVESFEQTMEIAEVVAANGVNFFRGGAFKPRTSPYSFQGLGEEGLKILAEVRNRFGMRIVTEVVDPENVDLVEQYADVLQIGARNMQNFSLLRRIGQTRKPVMLKRGMSATLDELLLAAEYIMSEGNYEVILCERGVRTFADHTRNTLDLSIVPAVQGLSHLPIIVDPSHGTGRRDKVTPLARAAIAVGADGIMVEVHCHPERALSDGPQALLPDMFTKLVEEVRSIHQVIEQVEANKLN
ncbi:MAG: 3-deoxy-7-phosphoheptulonate synthase [Blastocatellia bacterium AA13]|nr:MAG: 3-deoxy-7-phosphoheptulonate synthase [Blastocatellia bacterium AA13]